MDWDFLDVLWTMFIFFAWIMWFWLLFAVFGDLFRRHDIGGWTKALWTVFVIAAPFLGVFVYLISQGRGMAERRESEMRASRQQFDSYVQSVAATSSPTAEIERGKQLLDSGAITPAEFEAIKKNALSGVAS